jgi:catechol 2,3-dioxygenase-like lactoylglutathione lyase family enzyme
MMLDHVGFAVADYKRSKAFYEKALAPLGFTLLMEFSEAPLGSAS